LIPRPSLCRSYLFAPGNNQRLIEKVFDAGADAVVLDLEDSVALDRKEQARDMVAAAVRRRQKGDGPRIFVRINGVSTAFWQDDVRQVATWSIDGIRLPKAESAAQIAKLDQAISETELQAGMPNGSISIVPTIESALGVMCAEEIARHLRIEAICFGASDFACDMGSDPDPTGLQTLYAESRLALVSRATGIRPPIASVYLPISDLKGLCASSVAARRLGFFGRSCIHPTQIPIIHEVFTPSAKDVAEANVILESFHKAHSKGTGAFLMEDGRFVDQTVVRRAREIIALSERVARLKNSGER
jgi:citrate lyase subunit beta / citryl-CoA lyase